VIDNDFPLYAICFFTTLLFTVIAERLLIPFLKKRAAQPIYEEGPAWHLTKSGTPTMGGLAFFVASLLSLSLGSIYLFLSGKSEYATSLLLCLAYAAFNALIGIADDAKKLLKKQNAGLSPKQKLLFQGISAALFLLARYWLLGDRGIISFSFGEFDLGFLYYPLAFFVLLGITNCANLTDGIDGLASSVGFAVAVSLFYISCALSSDVAFIASAIMGATVGFLIFNLNPAKIFMGDTGSLFLGALGAASAIALGNPLLIVFVGGVYVIEGISVILQVLHFKRTGRRLFKMAPLHHHLEKCGWGENRICIVGIIATFLMSVPAFVLYLP